MNTGWVVGGVNMDRWIDWKIHHPDQLREMMERGRQELGFFQTPYVTWRPDVAMWLGPRQSGLSALDVDDMTEVEIRSHRLMEGHTQFFRKHAPGFEGAFSLNSAAQLGVRHTRRLARRRRGSSARTGATARRRRTRSASARRSAPSSRWSRCPTARWCRARSTGCSRPGGTSRATPTATASCARSRSAG